MFCRCKLEYGAPENTRTCPVCLAFPGALPVANGKAIEHTIKLGLALDCEIAEHAVFARKNYFYPDLPKGYQISQYESPIVQGGSIPILLRDGVKIVRLTRAHLEEDAGKLLHELHGMSGVDYNRAGTPLLEIVSEPDLRGSREAVAYARALHALVVWIGICDGNMQEGSFRCDANVSVRRSGAAQLGTRCEIKNLNSFRFMERAIDFEARRQIEVLEEGGRTEQETRLYDAERDETRSMRSKEDAQDYRYFPDPDLLPLVVTDELFASAETANARTGTPETKKLEYSLRYGSELSPYDLAGLTQSRETADYFDALMEELDQLQHRGMAKLAANFLLGEMAAKVNELGTSISASPITPKALAGLIGHVANQHVSVSTAKKLFPKLWDDSGKTVGQLSEELRNVTVVPIPAASDDLRLFYALPPDTPAGSLSATSTATISFANLWQVSDSQEIEKIVDEVLRSNTKQVEDFRAGKEKAFNSLVGQVMTASKGKANPSQVNEILRRKLAR
jgi:aspartyl-tRNA(Asn)/glutamyl-tRNA(Gln) amidotransferase subunit B